MQHSFWYCGFAFFGLIIVGYFCVAGSLYWLFYSVLEQTFADRSLHRSPPSSQAILRDIKLTVISAIVFSIAAVFVLFLYDVGATRLYDDLSLDQLWYWVVSFVAVLMLQDTYFYFIHRTFHHPQLFKKIHQGHHQSGEPTPWSAFALDLPDAIVQATFLVSVVFIIPLHFTTLVAVLMTMTIMTTIYHLGFEPLPAFSHHWLGRWFVNSTHHSMHHRKYKVHYGLYFTFWDRLLNTQDLNDQHQFGASQVRLDQQSKALRHAEML